MAISPVEREVKLPLSEQVFTDDYWGNSEAAQIIDTVLAKGHLDSLGAYFKRTVPRIRNHKTSPLPLSKGVDFAKLPAEMVVAYDFESLSMVSQNTWQRLGELMLNPLAQPEPDNHINWKVACSPEDLIKMCNPDTSGGHLKPGRLRIVRTYEDQPYTKWVYERTAWFGVIAPTIDGGSDLLSFPKLAMPIYEQNTNAANNLVPQHRPLINGAVTHTSSNDGMRIERIRSIEAYSPIRMDLST